MEAEEDACLENAHARVEGTESNGAHFEERGPNAMPTLVAI